LGFPSIRRQCLSKVGPQRITIPIHQRRFYKIHFQLDVCLGPYTVNFTNNEVYHPFNCHWNSPDSKFVDVGAGQFSRPQQETKEYLLKKTARRSQRRIFKYDQAVQAIRRDYLGHQQDPTTPLFGKDFNLMFRLSRQRFELLVQEIMHQKIPFFQPKKNLLPGSQASIYVKLLLPLKCLTYGVPPHCFTD
jgi:hypothetical protein